MMRPATPAQLGEVIRDAHDRRTRLRIAGRGTWPGRTGIVAPDAAVLDVSLISGIVEYVPGDLTLTLRSGTTIAELDEATNAHGQWCPLLPWGGDGGTVGATFATATHGPCSASLGAPRDIALGMEFVDGTGAVIRAGGRVVKNVAGFDLTRLLVGSWGSLGVITELSLRLRAKPVVDETWSVAMDPGEAARSRLESFGRGPLAPLAMETLDGRTLLRLGGNAAFVAASREIVRALGAAERCDPGVWTALRERDPRPMGAPASNALADPLAQRVKKQFDPAHIMNPGIMGEAYT
jgi:glycolate oxidase FAD binding subunit